MSRGKQGGNTGGIEYSPAKSARRGAVRKREDRRWAARSGPVTVSEVQVSGSVKGRGVCSVCGAPLTAETSEP